MNWMAHVTRMQDDNTIKKVLLCRPTGIRRPRLRWADSMDSDFLVIDEKNWKSKINRSRYEEIFIERHLLITGLFSYLWVSRMIAVGLFILALHPVHGWSKVEVPHGAKVAGAMPKSRPRNILNVLVFIERDDHHKKKPTYSCVAGNITRRLT
ncbi:hypothetical protein TNCV_4934041 [Trichonephila clavipes]|nr:hypothetical protein TNCV_4934041 [Trichonephila clavipes]